MQAPEEPGVYRFKDRSGTDIYVGNDARPNRMLVRQDDGSFADLPAEWFSPAVHPELEAFVRPAAEITVGDQRIEAVLGQPTLQRPSAGADDRQDGGADGAGDIVVGRDGDLLSGDLLELLDVRVDLPGAGGPHQQALAVDAQLGEARLAGCVGGKVGRRAFY